MIFASTDLISIISLLIVLINAFFLPFRLIVKFISDPTGPLINFTASINDLP